MSDHKPVRVFLGNDDTAPPNREAEHGGDAVAGIVVRGVSVCEARVDIPPESAGKAEPINLRQVGRSRRGLAGEPLANVRREHDGEGFANVFAFRDDEDGIIQAGPTGKDIDGALSRKQRTAEAGGLAQLPKS